MESMFCYTKSFLSVLMGDCAQLDQGPRLPGPNGLCDCAYLCRMINGLTSTLLPPGGERFATLELEAELLCCPSLA